jgi:hypothetical protein
LLAGAARAARADAPTDDLPAARTVGRAGAGLVSDDGIGALLAEPAGLARRTQARGQASLSLVDADVGVTTPDHAAAVADQSTGALAPAAAAEDAVGPLVIGAGYATTAAWTRALPEPAPGQPPADIARLYPYRYAGLGGSYTRRTIVAGAAWHPTDTLAIGVSGRLDQIALIEHRRLWAGSGGRDAPTDATRDVDLALDASAGIVPGGAIGVLYAPDAPIELAAGASASTGAHLDGSASAGQVGAPIVSSVAPSASIDLPAPITVRAGARWLAARWTAEVEGELALAPSRTAPTWTVSGVRVVDPTTNVAAELGAVPSLAVTQAHGSARAAVEVELARGLCWLTGGYAWSSRSTPYAYVAPAFADLGGHTIAGGIELSAAGFTITAGWSRTLTTTAVIGDGAVTQVNPFGAAAGSQVANLGTYRTDRDVVAISVELSLD